MRINNSDTVTDVPTSEADATWELLSVIRRIAATPLWGETIDDDALRADYADTDQYDQAENAFNPCCDTESSQLREIVELARLALIRAGPA